MSIQAAAMAHLLAKNIGKDTTMALFGSVYDHAQAHLLLSCSQPEVRA